MPREPSSARITAPAALIVNTRSRVGARLYRQAHSELMRAGVELATSLAVESERGLLHAVRSVVESKTAVLVIGGGDGTVSGVVDQIAYRNVTLGLLPLGTGNDFARTLGVPSDLAAACRIVAQGHVSSIDLVRLNDYYILNQAFVGVPAQVVHNVPNWLKRAAGRLAYSIAAVYAVMKARPFRAAIDVDGVRHEIVTTMVSIGNGRFYIPTQVHPPAGADHAARAIVQAPRDDRRLTLLRLALEFGLTGRLPPARLLSMSGREILIEAQPPQVLDVDGEAAGRTPARIAIAYGALRVFAPRPAQQPTLGQKSNLAA